MPNGVRKGSREGGECSSNSIPSALIYCINGERRRKIKNTIEIAYINQFISE